MDLSKYAEKKKKDIQTFRKQFAFSCFKSIVMNTPVDTGRARGNWQIGVNEDIKEEINRESPNGENIMSEPIKLNHCNGDDTIYISNNLPYITKLEYGGYSKNSKTGKTVNGFSKQAPQGMVGKTLADRQSLMDKALRGED